MEPQYPSITPGNRRFAGTPVSNPQDTPVRARPLQRTRTNRDWSDRSCHASDDALSHDPHSPSRRVRLVIVVLDRPCVLVLAVHDDATEGLADRAIVIRFPPRAHVSARVVDQAQPRALDEVGRPLDELVDRLDIVDLFVVLI